MLSDATSTLDNRRPDRSDGRQGAARRTPNSEREIMIGQDTARDRTSGATIHAAPFTPFDASSELALDQIPALADHLVRSGVSGAFVCGSNGEGPNMTDEERMAVADAWVRASSGRLRIFVHVGHPSVKSAQALTAHAAAIGADAASSVAAFYFKPDRVETLVEAIGTIASAAPELPFYYYHIPALTSVNLDMVRFLELAQDRISNLAGIKYTAPTLWEYQACLSTCGGKFDVLFGLDEMLLPALAVGARAAIGSTYNFAAPLYLKVIDAFEQGDLAEARVRMARLVEMVRVLLRFPPIPAQKAIMGRLGHDLGSCRLPLPKLSPGQTADLCDGLTAIGFWRDLESVSI
jgi:N-acetylneuraminate lyase